MVRAILSMRFRMGSGLPHVWLAALVLGGCGSSTPAPESAHGESGATGDSDADVARSEADDGGSEAENEPGADAANGPIDAGAGGDGAAKAGAPRPSVGCAADAGATASGVVNLSYGGTERSYVLHVPASAAGGSIALVLSLHGYSLSGSEEESLTAMDALADTEGFLIAYPNGVGDPTDWNAGACCSAASEGNRDDEGFLSAVVGDVAAHACVDLTRVYVAGFSNGGMMTGRLACDLAGQFAAAATVSGTAIIPLDTCLPSRPIPFMHIHGNADPLVPYDGGAGGLPLSGRPTPVFPAVADEIAKFRTADGCPSTSDTYFDSGNAQCAHWGPCQQTSEVVFCTIDQGGHAWPGGVGFQYTESSALDATKTIWTFFKGHTLP
jgi:polyhydroxybutyrate depolymerase